MTHARLEFTVGPQDTAAALGSGDLEVLATPRVLAWCEAATCVVADRMIAEDAAASGGPVRTSVGTRVALEHLAPSAVGSTVVVEAALDHRDGRLLVFGVHVSAVDGTPLADGQVRRVVVDAGRFMSRVATG